jgi:hypothetical protein
VSVDIEQLKITKDRQNRLFKGSFALFVCLVGCGLYYYFMVSQTFVEMDLEVTQNNYFKIYWAETGQPYSEDRMSAVLVTPERENYKFYLPNIAKIVRLRIDTHSYEGEATLKQIILRQEGWEPIKLSTPEEFGKLVPLYHIADLRIDDNGLWVKSNGNDPYFEFLVSPVSLGLNIGWLILRLAFISCVVLLILYSGKNWPKDLRFVPMLVFGVWILIIIMASISKRNAHPDEYVHINATAYYQDNWLPPLLEDPTIGHTYSVYGKSRLNNREIYYLFAGKFHSLMQSFQLPDYLSVRMFNIFLFGLIFLYTLRNNYARMVALPFLVSPQIWYVFSYCGSDAFALFTSFLLACELVDPESLLHRYLKGDGWWQKIAGAVALSALLGIVFLLKKNYYPFIVFVYLCLGVKLFLAEEFFWERKEAVKRLTLITLVGLIIFGLRFGADYMVNGPDRHEKLASMQEELAHPWYKPSTELDNKHVSLYLKARGTTLDHVINEDHWFERSFQTGFGVFGYFTIVSSGMYYNLVRWSGVALLAFVLGSVFLRGGLIGSGLSVAVVGLSAALVGVSLYHSWTIDMQPQGRYLFPIIPMFGILYAWNNRVVNRRFLILGVSCMYLLGVYCFVFEGLLRIPKVVLW